MRPFEFTKAEALSNDFVIIDDRVGGLMTFSPSEISAVCDRRTGIGADGILLLQPSKSGDFKMRTLNADGSEAEICGNGIRCAGRYAYEIDGRAQTRFAVETTAGLKTVEMDDSNGEINFRVDLGIPEMITAGGSLEVDGARVLYSLVSMGNPHVVIEVNDVDVEDVRGVGPVIENHEAFSPWKTNVEFFQVIDSRHLKMRVWERGAGETKACGTGAAAVLFTAAKGNHSDRTAEVALPGGVLLVEWAADGRIYISGQANIVYSGRFGEA